jgi:hypothetical protein
VLRLLLLERDRADDDGLKRGFAKAEARVFARLKAALGGETAVQMTRASWHTWQLLVMGLPEQRYESISRVLSKSCLEFQ